jgi:hypothetical protein
VTVQADAAPDLDSLLRYGDLGVDRVLVTPWSHPREGVDAIRRFGDAVLPRLG